MSQTIYGIKKFQAQLPMIARDLATVGGEYVVTRRGEPAFVAVPYDRYQELEDIILELNSPQLLKEIAQGRQEYRAGKAVPMEKVLADLNINVD